MFPSACWLKYILLSIVLNTFDNLTSTYFANLISQYYILFQPKKVEILQAWSNQAVLSQWPHLVVGALHFNTPPLLPLLKVNEICYFIFSCPSLLTYFSYFHLSLQHFFPSLPNPCPEKLSSLSLKANVYAQVINLLCSTYTRKKRQVASQVKTGLQKQWWWTINPFPEDNMVALLPQTLLRHHPALETALIASSSERGHHPPQNASKLTTGGANAVSVLQSRFGSPMPK